MSEITGYQPRPQAAALVRVRGRGPRSHELRRLLDHWLAMRAKERELLEKLGARHREFMNAESARDEALADEDEAEVTGAKVDPKKAKRLEDKYQDTFRERTAALQRVQTFRPRLVEAERLADHFAQNHALEIGAEMVPTLARSEQRFRDVIAQVGVAAQALDDEVFMIHAVQATLQAGEHVPSVLGGQVAEMLRAIGRIQGEPLTRLPAALQPLAEEAGMVTTIEGGDYIPANLPHPRGTRSMNELQSAQAARMDKLGAA